MFVFIWISHVSFQNEWNDKENREKKSNEWFEISPKLGKKWFFVFFLPFTVIVFSIFRADDGLHVSIRHEQFNFNLLKTRRKNSRTTGFKEPKIVRFKWLHFGAMTGTCGFCVVVFSATRKKSNEIYFNHFRERALDWNRK